VDGLIVRSNGHEVATELRVTGTAAHARLVPIVAHWAALGLTLVKAKASTGYHAPGEGHIPGTGPGPNVATGDYIRKMNVEMEVGAGAVVAHIGTDAVQARALENGDHQVDSRGRHHNTPPYPHWGPMADEIEGPFEAGVAAAIVT
jgi:hypothetical protein